jgi:hypothetical protein
MGTIRAIEAATTMTDMAGLERAMTYHLRSNHYPPVPREMVPVAIEAVQVYAAALVEFSPTGFEFELDELDLNGGATFQGRDTAPVRAIIEGHHLDAFVEAELERLGYAWNEWGELWPIEDDEEGSKA